MFVNFGEHKALTFLWQRRKGAVMVNYRTKGSLRATFADPFIQYNKEFILRQARRNHQNTAFAL